MADVQPKDLNEQTILDDSDIYVLQDGLTGEVKKVTSATTAAKANAKNEYREIGRTTLGVAGDLITITGLDAYKYLKVVVSIVQGGSNDLYLRFNNDSAANYAVRYSGNNAADTPVGSQTACFLAATETSDKFAVCEIINITAKEKLVISHAVSFGTAGAANAPTRWDAVAKWANIVAQINRVDAVNFQAGDFAIGSEIIVYGHN